MSKMLVVVFDEEKKAYEGSRALMQLHNEGSITLYGGAVVSRDSDGKLSAKDDANEGPVGTTVGMMTGALIGILGGPEGVVVGAAAGGMLGSVGDMINLGVGVDYLEEVGAKLKPGKVAVVAEIGETWVTPVDTQMEELGGEVFRRYRADVEDDQIQRDIDATKAELAELKAEYKEASDKNKAKLQAKIDASKARLSSAADRAEAKLASLKKEGEAKVMAIEKQMIDAKAETKEKLQKRAAEIRSAYDARTAKLKVAWDRTK